MIKQILIISMILCFIGISKNLNAQTHLEITDSTQTTITDTSGHIITDIDTLHTSSVIQLHSENTEHAIADEHEGQDHGGMEPLFFIIIALVVEAPTSIPI